MISVVMTGRRIKTADRFIAYLSAASAAATGTARACRTTACARRRAGRSGYRIGLHNADFHARRQTQLAVGDDALADADRVADPGDFVVLILHARRPHLGFVLLVEHPDIVAAVL